MFKRPAKRQATRRVISESCLRVCMDGAELACTLRRSNHRRSLALRVGDGGQVVVNAPMRMPEGVIQGFVGKHWHWIHARLRDQEAQVVGWETGARLPYLGGELQLAVTPAAGRAAVRLDDGTLHCTAPPGQAEQAIQAWYRRTARTLLAERLAHHASRAGRPLPPLRISNARTRWGSLSPKGVVSLNWRLIKAGWEEIDYVICHELAHFRQRNHSAAFWREVEALFPSWATVRRRLRENGRVYFQF